MWVPLKTVSKKRLQALRESGEIRDEPGLKYPRYKKYFDADKGALVDNLWTDIEQMATRGVGERLGYPTQKPEALLERIISTSSNKGDLVADFFCGCGTTIAVAEHLDRHWIGVDISHLAIKLIAKRLTDSYRGNKNKLKEIHQSLEVDGLPRDIGSARELAEKTVDGRFNFQDWIIEVMLAGVANAKKTADGGWDGYLTFSFDGKTKEVILIEVKSGHDVSVKKLREFIHVVDNRKAAIGVFVCFGEDVTKPMLHEAKNEGYYNKDMWQDRFDKIQIITVEDLLNGEGVKFPLPASGTFKDAPKKLTEKKTQEVITFEESVKEESPLEDLKRRRAKLVNIFEKARKRRSR